MKKWLKRLAVTVGVLLLIAGGVVAYLFWKAGHEPEWYAQARGPVATQHAAVAQESLFRLQNWAKQTTSGQLDAKPAAVKQYTIELTDQQINALLIKWGEAAGIDEQINKQMQDVRVRLHDGKITVAGRLIAQDRVVSMVFEPKQPEGGYTQLALDGIWAGEVPMPLAAVDAPREALAKKLSVDPAKIGIDAHNEATPETAGIYYVALLTDLLGGKTPDLYSFLQTRDLPAGPQRIFATRVRGLTVGDGKLAMTVELLAPEMRRTLVEELKALTKK